MSTKDSDISLTIGDKINWPFILANAILKFQESITKPEGMQSPQQVREAALVIYNMIPASWYVIDQLFTEDLENAITKIEVDTRVIWCGVRCGNLEDHPPRTEEVLDPYRLVNACVNLLDRRGYISKKVWKQIDLFEEFKSGEKNNE